MRRPDTVGLAYVGSPIATPCVLAIRSISRAEHGMNPSVSVNNSFVGLYAISSAVRHITLANPGVIPVSSALSRLSNTADVSWH